MPRPRKAAPPLSFGARLQEALEHASKKPQELADHLEIAVQSVSQALTGQTKSMTAENVARAAVFLGVSWFWLATGDGAKLDPPPRGRYGQPEPLAARVAGLLHIVPEEQRDRILNDLSEAAARALLHERLAEIESKLEPSPAADVQPLRKRRK